ncbi:PREDICTED: uncharacterized protein LOC109233555 [Nicotiana attenuata]|uniref:uncharacterized protein LOC109233555 n=1 Tax=Nicotiana attenuata TaxID=49451 RepID=UPI000904D257|nr:PREDICTED: uncharacterized protein LOC109233555 [Nicotiana attenuata]
MAEENSFAQNQVVVDTSHPLYLSPSDNPGINLVFTLFDGTGYADWRKSMLISLSAKNKLGLINGRYSKPRNDSPYFELWIRCNDMVMAWLLNSLTKGIRSSVLHSNSARDLWKQLEDRYGQSDVAQLFSLQRKLLETTQGSNDIATYFNNMKAIWDELNGLDARVPCTCVECTCEAKHKNKAIEERQKLVQFLMGLNETYTTYRGNIMMMSPVPTIDKAYSLLLQEERQRSIQPTMISPMDSSSFNVSTQKSGQYTGQGRMNFNVTAGGGNKYNLAKENDKRNMFCSYCQRLGHTVERCFKIHGYPIGFKTNMQGNKPRKFQNSNFIQGNAVSTEEDGIDMQGNLNQGTQYNSVSPSVVGISQDQYFQLMELLQQVKIGQQAASTSEVNVTANCVGIAPILPSILPDKSFIHSWILDSGASEHMTFDKSILFDIIALTQPLIVNLPNSFKIKVTHARKGLPSNRPLDLGRPSNGLYILRTKHYLSGYSAKADNINSLPAADISVNSIIHSMSNSVDQCRDMWDVIFHESIYPFALISPTASPLFPSMSSQTNSHDTIPITTPAMPIDPPMPTDLPMPTEPNISLEALTHISSSTQIPNSS